MGSPGIDSRMSRFAKYAFAVAVGGFLGLLYLRTLAPGLTWAYDGADGGDLITAAITGGVPHPTGYPTYLLLASVFLRLPLGSLAYRANLFSSVCMISAAVLIYAIVLKAARSAVLASMAGIAFGTFPLIWSQAIITEVNALHALFITLILYMTVVGSEHALKDSAKGLLAGLGIGNHVSTILALPLLCMSESHAPDGDGGSLASDQACIGDIRSLARRAAGLGVGLSLYILVPLRAAGQAPVNWGNAVNWSGFTWLVSGRMYWDRLNHFDGNYLWAALGAWSHTLVMQLGPVGLVLIFIALSTLFKRSRLYLATGWLAVIYSALSILYYSPDSYVYLIPVLISLSVWIGTAGRWLVDRMPANVPLLRPLASAALLGTIVLRAVLAVPAMDLSAERTAEEFAHKVLESAPQRAILVSYGDESTFALWYFHFAYGERPDLTVVAGDLLRQAWYRRALKTAYPEIVLPQGLFPDDWGAANPGRLTCRVEIESNLVCSV